MKKVYQQPEIQEHIQFLMDFMTQEYPNNYEIIIGPHLAELRNTATTMTFLNKKSLEEVQEKIQSEAIKMPEIVQDILDKYNNYLNQNTN